MSEEPTAPGDEPGAPGTEDEPTPPGIEETEAEAAAVEPEVVSSAPEQVTATAEQVTATAEPVTTDAAAATSAAYPYYGQQQADGSYTYDPQYAGYDQYYGYYGYGTASGYEGYTGYYADGTAYSYDPAGYPATAAPSGAVDSAHTTESGAAVAGPAEQTVVGQTIAGPVAADSAMPQGQTAVDNYGMEPIVGLLTSDEKAHLEQQQEEADIARQEAEQRLRDAEEKRQNARVKAEEQAAIVLAAQALAQAEAQAELHKQLQQRLTDAQAASVQEAEREKRKVQSVTLKGARLAFNAPKAAGKAPATTPAGAAEAATNGSAQARKPDMTIKLETKPQAPPKAGVKPEAQAPAPAPAKKPGQLFLPQPSTVKNAYVLMAQNKKSAEKAILAEKERQGSPDMPLSPVKRPNPPRSPTRPPQPNAGDFDSRNAQDASKRLKGRGNRRYRPEEGPPADAAVGQEHPGLNGQGGSRDREEHRSKHRHHRHRHRREGDPAEADNSSYPDDRSARHRPEQPYPRQAPPHQQHPMSSAPNSRPGQTLFPGAFNSYNPRGSTQPPPPSQPFSDRYNPAQEQPGMYPPSKVTAFPAAQQPAAPARAAPHLATSALPMLSDSSDEEDDLPLPGTTSTRAMSVLQKYLSGGNTTAAVTPQPAALSTAPIAPKSAPVVKAASVVASEAAVPHSQPRSRPFAAQPPAAAALGYSSDSDHSQLNGAPVPTALHRDRANVPAIVGDDMDMSPILGRDTGAELADAKAAADAKALAKLPAQLREAAAAAMARHKAELPNQPMERSIDIPGQPSGGQAQQAKRAQQRQYRQRGPDPDLDSAQPNQAAAEAAVTRMQEQEYEAKTRGKRMRADEVAEGNVSEDDRRRSKKHKKHKKHHKRDRSDRRDAALPESPAAQPQAPPPQDRRFGGPPQRDNFGPPQRGGFGGPPNRDNFGRRPDFNQQQAGQQGYNRQPYQQQQQGFQRRPGFNQDQGYNGRPGFNQEQGYNGRPDFNQRQDMGRVMGRDGGSPRRRRQFSDQQSHSRSRSRSRSFSRSRSRSYSRSRSRSASRRASPRRFSRSPRRYSRSRTPPPRRTFGLGPPPAGQAAAAAPVHGIPPPGAGPPPPGAPLHGGMPPASSLAAVSAGFGAAAGGNPLAGMFQPLPAAPPPNPFAVNQQAAAEKAAKAARRLYVGNVPFETTQTALTAFFDTVMTDTGAIASNISAEEGSAVTSCTLYDRSSATGPKNKYAFLNFRSVEETSNCTAFDGIYMKANPLKIRRPDDYDAEKVASLGPREPSSTLNALVLSQLKVAPPPPPAPTPPPAPIPAITPAPAAGEAEEGEMSGAPVTKVLKLEHMVARDELLDDEEYNDIVDDITEEIETKYGHIEAIAIPRPKSADDQATPGVGFVFVAFSDAAASTKAQKALHGRMFGENTIDAMYYSEQLMAQQVYS